MVFPNFTYDDPASPKASNYEQQTEPKTHIIPAAHGFAFEVKKGEHFRVVDLYGEQVVVGHSVHPLAKPVFH